VSITDSLNSPGSSSSADGKSSEGGLLSVLIIVDDAMLVETVWESRGPVVDVATLAASSSMSSPCPFSFTVGRVVDVTLAKDEEDKDKEEEEATSTAESG
jgi:hypothetical protein